MLFIGDSTMEQFSVNLMSALHDADCRHQIVRAESDLLAKLDGWYAERGRPWLTHVEKYKPDLLVMSTGAHQFENQTFSNKFKAQHQWFNASRLEAMLEQLFDQARELLPGKVIWKTISPGSCGESMLDDNPEPGVNFEPTDSSSAIRFFPDWQTAEWTRTQYVHYPMMDQIARAQAARAGIALLDSAPLYRRVDAHRKEANDCLHFCQEPSGPLSLLNVLLLHVLLSLPPPTRPSLVNSSSARR